MTASHRKITAILTARPGKAAELSALLAWMAGPCRAEPGNLRWDIWRDVEDPNRFVLDELYQGDEAIAAHRASEHFQHYLTEIGDLAERIPIVSAPVDVQV